MDSIDILDYGISEDGNLELYVNGLPFHHGFSIDLVELVNSVCGSGEHWIFTCHCSYPDCTGVYDGVYVEHWRDRIVWHTRLSKSPPVVEFDRRQCLQAILDALNAGDMWYAMRPNHSLNFSHDYLTWEGFETCLARVETLMGEAGVTTPASLGGLFPLGLSSVA